MHWLVIARGWCVRTCQPDILAVSLFQIALAAEVETAILGILQNEIIRRVPMRLG
jgi:hypothetical protein